MPCVTKDPLENPAHTTAAATELWAERTELVQTLVAVLEVVRRLLSIGVAPGEVVVKPAGVGVGAGRHGLGPRAGEIEGRQGVIAPSPEMFLPLSFISS
jgi:hypothetical protein